MSKSKEQESERAFNRRIEVFMKDRAAERIIRDFRIGLEVYLATKYRVESCCWHGTMTPWNIFHALEEVCKEDDDAISIPFESVTDEQVLIAFFMRRHQDFMDHNEYGPYEVISDLRTL